MIPTQLNLKQEKSPMAQLSDVHSIQFTDHSSEIPTGTIEARPNRQPGIPALVESIDYAPTQQEIDYKRDGHYPPLTTTSLSSPPHNHASGAVPHAMGCPGRQRRALRPLPRPHLRRAAEGKLEKGPDEKVE